MTEPASKRIKKTCSEDVNIYIDNDNDSTNQESSLENNKYPLVINEKITFLNGNIINVKTPLIIDKDGNIEGDMKDDEKNVICGKFDNKGTFVNGIISLSNKTILVVDSLSSGFKKGYLGNKTYPNGKIEYGYFDIYNYELYMIFNFPFVEEGEFKNGKLYNGRKYIINTIITNGIFQYGSMHRKLTHSMINFDELTQDLEGILRFGTQTEHCNIRKGTFKYKNDDTTTIKLYSGEIYKLLLTLNDGIICKKN